MLSFRALARNLHRPGRGLSVGSLRIPRLTARDDTGPDARDDNTT